MIIKNVLADSPSYNAGIRTGDSLIAINTKPVTDVLDYMFFSYDPVLSVTVQGADGMCRDVKLTHSAGEPLGLDFETYLMDNQKNCKNKCVFCFIDQMPKGCRSSLYVKDDDDRMSFLLGNYITLTNLSQQDIDRIIKMRISPLHISVHTTDGELREKMLKNPKASDILPILKRLTQAEIRIHTQIVLCPGYNDGEQLVKTLENFQELGDNVLSTAIVPVGLTAHRDGLPVLTAVTKEIALQTIAIANRYPNTYCSDELYLLAEKPLPAYEFYDGFPQLENGVGMMTIFRDEWETEECNVSEEIHTIVTGKAAEGFIKELLKGTNTKVVAIENTFFGNTVTVAGLVTGRDILNSLKGKELGRRLLVPKSMLRHESNVFLDDMTLEELAEQLNITVRAVEVDGGALKRALSQDNGGN